MYNTDLPNRADLPSSAQLKRSTILAALSAFVILITIVLPSEYAIDPLRTGRLFGLTEMGEIKIQLAKEAADDATAEKNNTAANVNPSNEFNMIADRLGKIEMMLAAMGAQPTLETNAPAVQSTPSIQVVQTPPVTAQQEPAYTAPEAGIVGREDEVSFTLTPGKGIEVKLVMNEGESVEFAWSANGAPVNFDTHGDGNGNKVSYEKGRGVSEDAGILNAAFTGNHGWFWRNRTDNDVTITLRTKGQYSDIKQVM